MEELSKRAKRRLRAGLLAAALLFLCGQDFFSQESQRAAFTRADAEKLLIVPKDDIFFTNKEAQFVLQIPHMLPSDVQTELPSFPDGVIFNSSKKSDYFSKDGEMGAEIDLWFTFRKTGAVSLAPLVIYVRGRRYSVKFKSVQVYENPKTILPRLLLVFEGGQVISQESPKANAISLEANKTARFTVYLQYAIQARQFAWSIPKDSIFEETKRYDTEAYFARSQEFSTKRIPIADFEWTPFSSGTTSLPEIRLMATAYSGRSVYLAVPDCAVAITGAKGQDASGQNKNEADFVYAYAWADDAEQKSKASAKSVSPFDCAKIAELRSVERRSLFGAAKIRQERAAAERAAGIQRSENEPLFFVFISLFAAAAIFCAASAILFALKKRFEGVFAAICALFLVVCAFVDASRALKRRGIITGGEISPVPEESSITKTQAGQGSRVLIKEEIQGWYYVAGSESGGWIKKENVAEIK